MTYQPPLEEAPVDGVISTGIRAADERRAIVAWLRRASEQRRARGDLHDAEALEMAAQLIEGGAHWERDDGSEA